MLNWLIKYFAVKTKSFDKFMSFVGTDRPKEIKAIPVEYVDKPLPLNGAGLIGDGGHGLMMQFVNSDGRKVQFWERFKGREVISHRGLVTPSSAARWESFTETEIEEKFDLLRQKFPRLVTRMVTTDEL